ncbi:PREDICTED: eIF-2-alpha kinase activator GCN1 isoform X4 [Lupinus angustifolius]|uniref:eIF-2-alpha kinase activator GCN1 isoform X4 n=1 Tax=Lupinus angustifolius TaxID=3871 RepID=UPI00092F994A|nr:PREDICTED: eIF-2-alpha kinase activator GCN1 isoform X4 [Lupinus angustifolius]
MALESLQPLVSTSSTNQRLLIFRREIPSFFNTSSSEMSMEHASLLTDIIFRTVAIYDDRRSRKAVDDVIVKALSETIFMKTFAAALVQNMEKQLKFQSHVGCYRLLSWSCLLLSKSQFAAISKNALFRVASAQASLLNIIFQRSFRERRACKKKFFSLFSQSPDIYKVYIEELKSGRIPYKDSPDILLLLLEFSSQSPSSFGEFKPAFLDIYVTAILSAKEKPTKSLTEAFRPLYLQLSHDDFQNIVIPSSVKMLKRNPEIVLESVGILLKSVNLDLSKYAAEILSVVLAQARHADEGRRDGALAMVKSLSQKSSNPDALDTMFNAVKAVIKGSEGRLAFPYQRVGMVNAIQELSNAPDGKYIISLSNTIRDFLLLYYKEDGNEDVKIAILSAIASWAVRSPDMIQESLLSFLVSGLKEKETLRRGFLRSLHAICKNADSVLRMSPLFGPLVQLVKTGFTKAVQRLDGIYALLIVGKIAAVDIKAEETLVKEKLWSLISQNEPSLLPISMAAKLSIDDSMACIDLLEVLLVEHLQRTLSNFSVRLLLQLMIFFMCHLSWDIRRRAYNVARKIFASSPQLAEDIFFEFSKFLSLIGEKLLALRISDTDVSLDPQVPFLPSVEVLVKALLVMSPAALKLAPDSFVRIIFCSHHPCIVGSARRDAVWKRLFKCMETHGFDVADLVSANVVNFLEVFLGPSGLKSADQLEQQAAISSLCTLMSINPGDTYSEFEKRMTFRSFIPLKECFPLSKEFMLLNLLLLRIQSKLRVASGCMMLTMAWPYQDHARTNHSVKRDQPSREVAGAGKRDTGKATKKPDKGKTAKEEARELQLMEEASVRDRVHEIQKNLSLMLRSLGEMAMANSVFAHSKLPSMVKFVEPLLRSPIVGDEAFETMVKLSRCTASPLCNWALDISTALRLIVTDEVHLLLDLVPLVADEEIKDKSSFGLFERILDGLSTSCKSGALPVDSFSFVFPIIERILLCSKKTKFHDNVLQILYLHLDPHLPLPRIRMLSVLYHVLGVVPAYQASVGPALNELSLGLRPDEVASALYGVYAKDIHVRMACLNAVKCIPAVANRTLPKNVDVATNIWIALHDPEKSVAEVAEDVWDHYGLDFGTDFSGLYKALSHVNYNVRLAAAEGLAAALDEHSDSIQESLSTLFSLYIRDTSLGGDNLDAGWLGRQGIALALHSAADVLRTKDLPVVMTFLISRALADPNADVRGRMINAGILIIDKNGKDNVSLLFPIFENYLNKTAPDEEKYDLVREGVVIFTGALAKHLAKDDPKVHTVVDKLLDVLNTPSEAVQRAVSSCLSPLMQSKQDDAAALVNRLMDQLMKSDKYGERRGAAFGLAGVIKGFGLSSLKKHKIVIILQEALAERNSAKSREGALLGFECLCETLGRLFEPYVNEYVIQMLPLLLVSFSDQVVAVREAAECAARAMMSQLSAQGVKLVLPSLLKGLEDKAWRTKQSSVLLLGAMAYCAPQQLSQCLPKIVPKLTEVLTDTHPKVQSAGQMALQQVGSVIKNPEIAALVPTLLKGLSDPNEHTKYSLDILLQTTFINSIDSPSLALLVPIVHRGLRERSHDTKKRASQIVGNMCSLVTESKDMIPYIGLLLPEVKKVLVDPIPEVRSVAARAIGSLIGGMGEDNFPDLVPWLFETLKSDNSNVERSGAAQGLSEVLTALGIGYFEHVLPDVIRNCSHQKASVRDGYLTLFKYLPRSLGVQFQNYLPQVLPSILDGLADENESVRDAALGAGHVLVEHYATTSLPLLLPAVEDGIFNDNWRIRQSSVELLGDLLFKVAGTSGKALLEGGSDDEGSSTEAHGRAIIEVLGREKRNEILAALYMVRADVSLSVRQAALHVWKTIVANTPKTLREIMPVLMDTLIASLASSSSERRQVAGRSLGELVRKLGERVLPLIIPILSKGLSDPDSGRRQGVCVGLSEVMASAGKSQLLSFMNDLILTIRTALCDSVPEVRESAGVAFSTLYKGMQAIDEIVPTLLHALEDDKTSDTALDGLKQILSVRTSAVLPHILPKLVHLPLSAFNAHALGALAEVAGPGLNFHLGTVLPPLLLAMDDDDKEVQTLATEAAETVVLVIDEEGVESLMSELLKGVNDSQAAIRRSCAYLIGYFFKNSKLDLDDEAPNMISTLIILLSDPDSSTVTVAWEALSRVTSSVPKELLPSYIKIVRDAVSTSRDKERRKKKGGPIHIPGFCLPKALQPILPIFLQGLISGSAELREQAAIGLGELIEVTSEQSLKAFVIPITGPLIRIIGDRFPWQVKSAILSTLTIMIRKGGISLKPFLPQLQTTFVKCLQDSTRTIRSSAALALGKLSGLSTRVDPLVSDLLSTLQGSDGGVREAILTALKGVVKHAGKCVSSAVRDRTYSVLKDLIHHDDDKVRIYAASIMGILTQYLEDDQLTELIQELSNLAYSPGWSPRHGSILTISSFFLNNPASICSSSLFPAIVDCLRDTLKDEKFPLRETSTKALGRLLLYKTKTNPSDNVLYKDVLTLLVLSTHDDSSEVRRRALSAIKAVAKENPSAILSHGNIIGPALGECLKDATTPVRLAAERCAVHAFQLTKGSENVQAAQKYITGLDARRLAKLPEHSDDSGDSDEDNSNT